MSFVSLGSNLSAQEICECGLKFVELRVCCRALDAQQMAVRAATAARGWFFEFGNAFTGALSHLFLEHA
eukprot:1922598-Amphidinium_carterae.1